jgi:hypothetical protein
MTTANSEGVIPAQMRVRTGLVVRLMAAMVVVLLPFAILSYIQSVQNGRVADARARAAILGDTMLAATPQIEAILRGIGVVAGRAAAFPDLSTDPACCIKTLSHARAQSGGTYSFITYWRRDGAVGMPDTIKSIATREWAKEVSP